MSIILNVCIRHETGNIQNDDNHYNSLWQLQYMVRIRKVSIKEFIKIQRASGIYIKTKCTFYKFFGMRGIIIIITRDSTPGAISLRNTDTLKLRHEARHS